jgi:hypothetical protein
MRGAESQYGENGLTGALAAMYITEQLPEQLVQPLLLFTGAYWAASWTWGEAILCDAQSRLLFLTPLQSAVVRRLRGEESSQGSQGSTVQNAVLRLGNSSVRLDHYTATECWFRHTKLHSYTVHIK